MDELEDRLLRLADENKQLRETIVELNDNIRKLNARCTRYEEALQRQTPGTCKYMILFY